MSKKHSVRDLQDNLSKGKKKLAGPYDVEQIVLAI